MSFRLCLLRSHCKAGALHTDAGHLFPHEVYALAVATSTGFSYVCYPVTNSPHEKSPPPQISAGSGGLLVASHLL